MSKTSPAFETAAMFECSIKSPRPYPDPFNDIEIDAVFSRDGRTWRVPAFWRGRNHWAVRFTPPTPGKYEYRLECSDRGNAELNSCRGTVSIGPYEGNVELLKRGPIRISPSARHFEFADGTPMFWLGDTWWTNLSDRLSWREFKTLAADRMAKGFTVAQTVVGLIPLNEEKAPTDPGFCNEGGSAWEAGFRRINPRYFHYADRRILHMLECGLTPVLVGAWLQCAYEAGEDVLKKHWRNIVARYGALPVIWAVGGEVYDTQINPSLSGPFQEYLHETGRVWAEVAKYIRQIDPYDHPLTVHEVPPPYHGGFADKSLTDFDFIQPGHLGWASMASCVAQITSSYGRKDFSRPIIMAEMGYERLGGDHYENFQRAAFWLSMLNGAAGFSYGAIETAEGYGVKKTLHRTPLSFTTWEEAAQFPGSRQVGLSARFLRQFEWNNFSPRPDWVNPSGSTLLNLGSEAVDLDLTAYDKFLRDFREDPGSPVFEGEWSRRQGNAWKPYAAGISRQTRLVYLPYLGFSDIPVPTITMLEPGVHYETYYWDPIHGVRIDLGWIKVPPAGDPILSRDYNCLANLRRDCLNEIVLIASEKYCDVALSARICARDDSALVLRYQSEADCVLASYSASAKCISVNEWIGGTQVNSQGITPVNLTGSDWQFEAEVRGTHAVVKISADDGSVTSQIVCLKSMETSGNIGFVGNIRSIIARRPAVVPNNPPMNGEIVDAEGRFRGRLPLDGNPGSSLGTTYYRDWSQYGRKPVVLLDAYLPEKPPFRQDWILAMNVPT